MKRSLMLCLLAIAILPEAARATVLNPWGIWGRPPCHVGEGRALPTHRHTNPDGSEGGYVSDDSYVAEDAIIERGAQVCGAQVGSGARIGSDARLNGRGVIVEGRSFVNSRVE